MEVTDVRVRKLLPEGKMKAIVSITLDDAFVVHDVKVVDGQSGLFVAMPSRKVVSGEFRDIAHPITQQARDIIQSRVLEVYQQALAEAEQLIQVEGETIEQQPAPANNQFSW
ncbi:MAG: septation regulator SpoVG [Bacillota bacterium]|nr:septation regulator SpoVG [Bacillota bacterium]